MEWIYGNQGDDLIYGNFGAESISGGTGHDTIFGGQGDDTMLGDAGNDYFYGNRGDDSIESGTGMDVLFFLGGFGDDIVNDFALGTDLAIFSSAAMSTIMVGSHTLFNFADGSSVQFLNVTMTSADLVFI